MVVRVARIVLGRVDAVRYGVGIEWRPERRRRARGGGLCGETQH